MLGKFRARLPWMHAVKLHGLKHQLPPPLWLYGASVHIQRLEGLAENGREETVVGTSAVVKKYVHTVPASNITQSSIAVSKDEQA